MTQETHIKLRKIATMLNISVFEAAEAALDIYVDTHQKQVRDYDSFFGVEAGELYGENTFNDFLMDRRCGTDEVASLAEKLYECKLLPEMIWRYDQLHEFAEKHLEVTDKELEQLWQEYEETLNE